MINSKRVLRRAVRLALATAAGSAAAPLVLAQATPSENAAAAPAVEEVVVTHLEHFGRDPHAQRIALALVEVDYDPEAHHVLPF